MDVDIEGYNFNEFRNSQEYDCTEKSIFYFIKFFKIAKKS